MTKKNASGPAFALSFTNDTDSPGIVHSSLIVLFSPISKSDFFLAKHVFLILFILTLRVCDYCARALKAPRSTSLLVSGRLLFAHRASKLDDPPQKRAVNIKTTGTLISIVRSESTRHPWPKDQSFVDCWDSNSHRSLSSCAE